MMAKRRDRTKRLEGEEKQKNEGGKMKWGMKVLKEIRQYQSSSELLIRRIPFQRGWPSKHYKRQGRPS